MTALAFDLSSVDFAGVFERGFSLGELGVIHPPPLPSSLLLLVFLLLEVVMVVCFVEMVVVCFSLL